VIFAIKNIAGTTALVGVPTVTIEQDEIDGGGSIAVAITAKDADDTLVFTATGVAATDIYWNAVVEWSEIQFVVV
jgi:hypothetical protein